MNIISTCHYQKVNMCVLSGVAENHNCFEYVGKFCQLFLCM